MWSMLPSTCMPPAQPASSQIVPVAGDEVTAVLHPELGAFFRMRLPAMRRGDAATAETAALPKKLPIGMVEIRATLSPTWINGMARIAVKT